MYATEAGGAGSVPPAVAGGYRRRDPPATAGGSDLSAAPRNCKPLYKGEPLSITFPSAYKDLAADNVRYVRIVGGPLQGLLFPFACDHWHACVASAGRMIHRRDGRNLQIESRANTREILLAGAARRGQDTGGRGVPCGFCSPIT